jgi:uncharacterized membrane protein YsdA (DUF1294 family)
VGHGHLFAIPAFLLVYMTVAILWKPPLWAAALYVFASAATFVAYAMDKSAAATGGWRTPESTLHLLSFAGGWPGALLAQQLLRYKSSKEQFRQVFWAIVVLNVLALIVLASPFGRTLLGAL